MTQRVDKNRSATIKPGKTNNGRGTPHNAAVKKMVQQYKNKCDVLSEKILWLDLFNDTRSIEEIQTAINTKAEKLGGMILKRRPLIDRKVLQYEIDKLEKILKVKPILLEIADAEMRLAGMKFKPKSPKEDVQALEEKISNLRAKLPFAEIVSDTQRSELQKEIETLRTHLGGVLWSLMQYEDELDNDVLEYMELTKETLKITPRMGNVKGRGVSGLDLGR